MDPGKPKIKQLSYYSFKKRAGQRVSRASAPADVAADAKFRRPSAPAAGSEAVHSCALYTEGPPREGGPPCPPAGIQPQPGADTQATLLRDLRSRAPRLWSF